MRQGKKWFGPWSSDWAKDCCLRGKPSLSPGMGFSPGMALGWRWDDAGMSQDAAGTGYKKPREGGIQYKKRQPALFVRVQRSLRYAFSSPFIDTLYTYPLYIPFIDALLWMSIIDAFYGCTLWAPFKGRGDDPC
jgi:hypothetical protein